MWIGIGLAGDEPPGNRTPSKKPAGEEEAFKIIGYQPSWAGGVDKIPYDKLTHINYSFILPNADGTFKDMPKPTMLTELVNLAHENNVKAGIAGIS